MTINESIVLVRFPEAGRAYQALSELRQLDAGLTGLSVRSAALLERRRFDATVERQPTSAVTAEMEAAAAAFEAAQKEANRVLRERKGAEFRAKVDERVDTVKEKLHIG
jgi:hypothetical protein